MGLACEGVPKMWVTLSLAELEEGVVGPRFYKHAAPNGAVARATTFRTHF